MQAKLIDELFKEVKDLFNKDKLPTETKTLSEIEHMIKVNFLYMRKFFQKPYATEFNMEKVARFKIRYRHVRARINELVQEAKSIRDGKITRAGFTKIKRRYELEGDVHPEDLMDSLKAEIKYWWILKQKYMAEYTKTSRYKRLQLLRKKWQEDSQATGFSIMKLKEDYKPFVKTQMPINKDKWLID